MEQFCPTNRGNRHFSHMSTVVHLSPYNYHLALSELNHFINRHADNTKYLKVWGNGATFDNVILRGAYERAGQICPWAYWNDHDVRTIVTLGRSIGFDPKMDMPFDGERHNALADARHQAKYVSAIWQKLIPATSTEL